MADYSSGDSKPHLGSPSGTPAHPDNVNNTDESATSNTQAASAPNSQPQSGANDSSLDAKQEHDLDAEINNPATASADADVNMDAHNDASAAPPQASASQSQSRPAPTELPNGLKDLPAVLEPRIPQKKDTSLREFLGKMDDYAPLIPDAVTDYYLTLAGLPPPPETDRRLARLLALATQKFIADIASDAYQYSRIRSTNTTSNNPLTGLGGAAGFGLPPTADEGAGKGKKDAGKSAPLGGPRAGYGGGGANAAQGRTVLTMEDLGMAVGEYGVNVKRGEFYR